MSRFIKLSRSLINTKYIRSISQHDEMYKIHYNEGQWGCFILAVGVIDTYNRTLTICKTKDPDDYDIMTSWIDKQQN